MPQVESGGGQFEYHSPQKVSDGLSINSPELPALALKAERLGVPLATVLDVLKAQQPHVQIGPDGRPYNDKDPASLGMQFRNPQNVNNNIVDLNNPANEGAYFGTAPVPGAMPLKDNTGRIVDWYLPGGAAGAIRAGKRAEAEGTAPYQYINVPTHNGAPRMISTARAAEQGGDFVGQSPGDTTYGNNIAGAAADQFKGLQTAGQQASGKIARYKQLDTLLGNFEGGKLSPAGLEIASAANSLGFKMSPKLSNAQAADAIGKQLVLEANGGSLGTGFSNADRDFLQSTVPGILQSAGGRRQLITIGIKTAERQQDVANKARQWQQRFGRIDAPDATGHTFQDYLDAYAARHPVFGK
jgi:hypothetical protein